MLIGLSNFTIKNKTLLFYLLSTTVLFTACRNDKNLLTDPNSELVFDIVSTSSIEVLEVFDNGWIKKGVKLGTPRAEFEYFANGNIRSYKLYRPFNSMSLSFEHERDESNLPVSSKFYDEQKNLYTTLTYSEGLITSKVIFADEVTTTSTYSEGRISQIVRVDTPNDTEIRVSFDHSTDTKNIVIFRSGQEVRNMHVSTSEFSGTGYDTHGDLELANLLNDPQPHETRVFSTLINSYEKEIHFFEPGTNSIPPNLFFDIVDEGLSTRFGDEFEFMKVNTLINNAFYRGLWEQYSWNEGVVYFSNSEARDLLFQISPSQITNRVNDLRNQEGDLFPLLYGDSYGSEYLTGKEVYIVGAIRNLPTDEKTRNRLLNIAELYSLDLLNGSSEVSDEDLDLLAKAKFEMKLHSDALNNPNGYVIESTSVLNELLEQVTTAPSVIKGRRLRSYR